MTLVQKKDNLESPCEMTQSSPISPVAPWRKYALLRCQTRIGLVSNFYASKTTEPAFCPTQSPEAQRVQISISLKAETKL